MKIREPKFKTGQRVIDKSGNVGNVIDVNSYHFDIDQYWYDVKRNGGTYTNTEPYLKPYPMNVWNLQKGEECCFIDDCGTVLSGTWNDCSWAIKCRQAGNVFLTKEEAEFECERRKIETEMLRLGGRREFKKGENNWFIYYNDGLNVTVLYDSIAQGAIYFDSENEAYNAIKKIGKSRIKKYIFGVNE